MSQFSLSKCAVLTVHVIGAVVCSLVLISMTGCKPPARAKEARPEGFDVPAIDNHLSIAIDVSGSFLPEMAEKGRAYKLCLAAIDKFFRDRKSTNKLLIVQISGSQSPILFEGSPQAFMQSYPSADSFRRFLLSKADPSGSRVYESIADAMEHVDQLAGMTKATKKTILVLSDMDNNVGAATGFNRLDRCLRQWATDGGNVGLYFVNQKTAPHWRNAMKAYGFGKRGFVSESFSNDTPLVGF